MSFRCCYMASIAGSTDKNNTTRRNCVIFICDLDHMTFSKKSYPQGDVYILVKPTRPNNYNNLITI